jgi:hypothetical protein
MNRVARRFAKQGLQIQFVNTESIDPTSNWIPTLSVVRNFRKIWDPGISLNEIPNRFQMNPDELHAHLRAELEYFSAQHARASSELRKQIGQIYLAICRESKTGLDGDTTKVRNTCT